MPDPIALPEIVARRAREAGLDSWIDGLPALLTDLCREWSLTRGEGRTGGTESLVLDVVIDDGRPAVLKLLVPHDPAGIDSEIEALRISAGRGAAALYRSDAERGALLLERLGPSLDSLRLPIKRRHEILCATARRFWRPAPGAALPSGADKGRWLIDYIRSAWEQLDRPCDGRAIDHALACAQRRIAAHDDARQTERVVLVHGDLQQWNTLQQLDDPARFKVVDPDGLLAEPEYDLGIIMREDPHDLLRGDPRERARRLARLTGTDPVAIWEWGVVERVATGLVATGIEMQPIAGRMLRTAERVAQLRD